MTTPHETAYPRFKPDPTAKELRDIYTPTEAELAWAAGVAQGRTTRLAVLIQLKTFQRLGYFVGLSNTPSRVTQHVAHAAGYARIPPAEKLASYDTSGARRTHLVQLREYLDVRVLDDEGRTWLVPVAENAAQTKHIVPDIINVMLEELVHHRYEIPAFSTLDRIAIAAREKVHEGHFERIAGALTPAMRTLIDELLTTPSGATYSGWQALKREPKRPTNKEVRNYLLHVQRLRRLAEQLPAVVVPVPKLKYFRAMARALDASELAELKPDKRYALATIFNRSQYSKTLDDAAELFIRLIQRLENS